MRLQKTQLGFSLLEVNIGWSIFAVAFVGVIFLQVRLLRENYRTYLHNYALVRAESLLERLRAHHAGGASAKQFSLWRKHNASLLPKLQDNYQCHNSRCRVTLTWFREGVYQVELSTVI